MKQINENESKQEFLARQSHEQLEIFVMNAEMCNDILRDRLFLLSGCRDFGGQDGTNGSCCDCFHNNRDMFERCCLFQGAAHTYLHSKYASARQSYNNRNNK